MSPVEDIVEHPPPFTQEQEEMVITQEEHADKVLVIGHKQDSEWCTLTNEEKIKRKLNE